MVQPQLVHVHQVKGRPGHFLRNDAVIFHLGEIPHPFQDTVGQPGGASAAPGHLQRAPGLNLHLQHPGRMQDDQLKLLHRVELQMMNHPEAVTQRRRQKPCPGGGPHQGEFRQFQAHGAGGGAFPYHDVDTVVFHGRVQDLLHLAVQAVDLVHEQQVSLLQVVQDGRHLPGLLDGGPAGDLQMDAHLIGDDSRQRGLPQAGRPVEQHMVQGVPPQLCRFDIYLQILLHLGLTDIVIQFLRAQRAFYFDILFCDVRLNRTFLHHLLHSFR